MSIGEGLGVGVNPKLFHVKQSTVHRLSRG
jgi:hypothetical protein